MEKVTPGSRMVLPSVSLACAQACLSKVRPSICDHGTVLVDVRVRICADSVFTAVR
ncbi:Uncharacterised protein [Mycobacteroides abscessus subsp. abscessus]|nr:Uncharacterised protein [Mycobacteroides abscessus subsp. abscessus]